MCRKPASRGARRAVQMQTDRRWRRSEPTAVRRLAGRQHPDRPGGERSPALGARIIRHMRFLTRKCRDDRFAYWPAVRTCTTSRSTSLCGPAISSPTAAPRAHLVEGTVPRGHLDDDMLFYTGKGADGKPSTDFPVPVTRRCILDAASSATTSTAPPATTAPATATA